MNHDDTRTSDSTDAKVTQDLIETLVDGQQGYADAAEKLRDESRPDLVARFDEFSTQREQMANDLRSMAARYGDHVDSDGSAAAGLHRGWMAVKDALTGTDADAIVKAAIKGEEHAVSDFEKALDDDISADLRTKVQEQLQTIRSAKEQLETIVSADA